MSKLRISGDTSGYYDLNVPDIAGTNTIELDRVIVADASGNVGIGRSPTAGYKLDIEANNQRSRLLGTTGYVVSEVTNNGGSISMGKENSTGGGFMSTTGAYDSVLVSQGAVNMVFATNNTERMRISSTGNVGIGTTAPAHKLHIKSTAHDEPIALFEADTSTGGDVSIRLEGGAVGNPDEIYIEFSDKDDASNSFAIGLDDDASKLFFGYGVLGTMNGHNQMVLQSNGNVGIGTSSPSATLHIKSSSSNPVILFEENTGQTQTAKIEFDQAAQNTLTLSTQYQSATNANRIIISPAEQPAIIVRGGSQTGSGAGSSKSYGYTSNTAFGGPKWATWTESIMTPDGGQQEVRIIEDHTGRWILAGRFAANAQTSIQGVWSSVRGLSTSTGQDVTAFSADFGSSYPTECRYIGATDWTNYYNTRTIDFIHGIPTGRPWKSFMSNGNATGMGQVTGAVGGAKNGWTCRGAYDGFGRWSNPNYLYHKMSDVGAAIVHSENAFINPVANAFNWETNGDAKITVNGTGLDYSGQDADASSGFGNDDELVGFYDEWPALISNFASSTYQTYSSAVWVMIKMGGI